MLRPLILVHLIAISLPACDASTRRPDPDAPAARVQKSPPLAISLASSATPPSNAPADDPALHRTYGAADMKLAPCAALLEDGSIEGKNCENGIVLYGPYANIPANTNVKVSFDIQPTSAASVACDVVSQVGSRFHAATDDAQIEAGKTKHVGFTIRIFEGTVGFENRIWVRTTGKTGFKITNMALQVP
jgi:hypothetical protein